MQLLFFFYFQYSINPQKWIHTPKPSVKTHRGSGLHFGNAPREWVIALHTTVLPGMGFKPAVIWFCTVNVENLFSGKKKIKEKVTLRE